MQCEKVFLVLLCDAFITHPNTTVVFFVVLSRCDQAVGGQALPTCYCCVCVCVCVCAGVSEHVRITFIDHMYKMYVTPQSGWLAAVPS